MKLTTLRSDAPRKKFPVYISNSGRSHEDAARVAAQMSVEWDISLSYEPDADGCKQGSFYMDATNLTDLEVEGLNPLIHQELQRWPEVYDVDHPRK